MLMCCGRRIALVGAALACHGSALGVIQTVELGYQIRYQQTGATTPPVLQNYAFFSQLTSDNEFDALQAFVRPTASTAFPQRELIDLDGGLTYEFVSGTYATESAVRTDFPAGNYQFSVAGGTLGNRSANFSGPTTLLWPTLVPRFLSGTYTTITAGVRSYDPITLTFNSATLPAGATLATTSLEVRDASGFTVYSASLPNTATSVVIPANDLDAGNEHTVELRFEAVVNFPGAGFVGGSGMHRFRRSTTCTLITLPPCQADFNGLDGVDLFDLFDYLNAWFSSSPAANMDTFSSISTTDLFIFLNLWFARC
ncbi:MAG: hypothetical protein K2W85_15115 [Phycisphaerales bacterium]|nr:hypothetical protein [Phycisphaerales bacterium]